MIEDLSDEELLAEWEKTKAASGSAPGGPGPLPTYSEAQHRRHMAAEAELKRRGFGENPPGYWTRMPMKSSWCTKCVRNWVVPVVCGRSDGPLANLI